MFVRPVLVSLLGFKNVYALPYTAFQWFLLTVGRIGMGFAEQGLGSKEDIASGWGLQ
jgi:hypothetical protein